MKKTLLIVLLLFALVLAGIYLFLPARQERSATVTVNASPRAVYRSLLNNAQWKLWWPGEVAGNAQAANLISLQYEGKTYEVQKLFEGAAITVKEEQELTESFLKIITLKVDSSGLQWNFELEGGSNPFSRIAAYFRANAMEKDLQHLLGLYKVFLEKEELLYGFRVAGEKVKDTVMVATSMVSQQYPDTSDVYVLVRQLRQHITAQGAREMNYPMLHVNPTTNGYSTMVAIPVNRVLPETGSIFLKRMVPGNILVAEVKGGPFAIRQAVQNMEDYVLDFKLTSPAIPFESLVTDRTRERDTSRWVTRIYYPIF